MKKFKYKESYSGWGISEGAKHHLRGNPRSRKKMRKYKVEKFRQSGKDFYNLIMTVKELENIAKVPLFDPNTEKGYQRLPSQTRIKNAAEYITKGGVFPTSILVNYRGKINFETEDSNDLQEWGTLRLDDNQKLNIVDGQHRELSLLHAIKKMQRDDLRDFQIPVVISNFQTELEEMQNFRIINRKQKSVPTDLTDRLIAKELEETTDLEQLMRAGRYKSYRKFKSVEIVKKLNEWEKSPWYQKIKQANVTKNQAPDSTVNERSMTQSLKSYLKVTDATSNIDKNVEMIANFWKAIHELCPEAAKDEKKYPYMWNTTGIYTLHMILPTVMELAKGEYTKEKFKDILQPLPQMKSEYWQKNGLLKGIGGLGGFNKIANDIRADLVFQNQ